MEHEDKEVKTDYLAHQASPELGPQDPLAPLGLVGHLVAMVPQGSGVHPAPLATATPPSALAFLTMVEEDSQDKPHGNDYSTLLTVT